VLADILGLSFYDHLEERAKELARQQEMEKAQLEGAIQDIDAELAHKPDYEAELIQAQGELSCLEKSMSEQEPTLNNLRQEKESLENKKRQSLELEEHIRNTQKDLERWDEQLKQHNSRVREYEELIDQRATIEDGYAHFTEAKKSNDEFDRKFRQSASLSQRQHQMEMRIVQASQSLVQEHAVAQDRIKELETNYQRLPHLKGELQQAQAKLQQLAQEEERLHQKRGSSQELRNQANYLETQKIQLQGEIREIGEKLDLLLTPSGANCPLCETELGPESLKLIETKYKAEKKHEADSLAANQSTLTRTRLELESLEKEMSGLETQLSRDKTVAQGGVSVLSQNIAKAEESGSKLMEERKRLTEIEERLVRKDFALPEQEALGEVEAELAKLDYDASRHEEVRQKLVSLEEHDISKRKLEEADRLVVQEREFISRAGEAVQDLLHNLEENRQKERYLTVELERLSQVTTDLIEAEKIQQSLVNQQKQALETLWQVKAKLQRSAELEARKKEKGNALSHAAQEEKIYRDLAQAFGKRGIQALLIEAALPEIEAEANKLLGRMTDNRMHVKIETQRPTKKGDVIETLDINISDELGTRSYEMFSGGETFRINFAIRIALSRLLARRAGAPLPTLVIDEGFGTQDSTGIEKLKEAINSIQDYFEKILVITHVEELRDAFPARIDVVKTSEGSTISIS
jgi:exonuclease SbcC